MRYAAQTTVTVGESRAELRSLLERHGACAIRIGNNRFGGEVVLFMLHGREIRFKATPPAGEQERRAFMRALVLMFRAKLTAIDNGLTTFDAEFLAHIGTSDGSTLGDRIPLLLGA